jgi:hypothetical protein
VLNQSENVTRQPCAFANQRRNIMPSKRVRAQGSAPAKQHGHAAPKPTVNDLLTSKSRANRASIEFLKVDLQTALTFAALASNTKDPAKKARNQRAARKAYDTILRLIDRVALTEDEASFFQQNLFRLKRELMDLGEVL